MTTSAGTFTSSAMLDSNSAAVEPLFSEIFCHYYKSPWQRRLKLFYRFSGLVIDHKVGQRFLCQQESSGTDDIRAEGFQRDGVGFESHNVDVIPKRYGARSHLQATRPRS